MKVDVCRDPALTTVPILRVRARGYAFFAWGRWLRTGKWPDRPALPGVRFERDRTLYEWTPPIIVAGGCWCNCCQGSGYHCNVPPCYGG